MKTNIVIVAVVVGGLQVMPCGWTVAQAGLLDAVLGGVSQQQTPRQDSRSDSRSDWRDRDDSRSDWRDRDNRRSDSSDRDESRHHSRNQSQDPDVIVKRAYQDVLNRDPDQEGLRTYRSKIIDDNWSEKDVRDDLRRSDERKGRTPAAATVIVRRAYQDILGREPDDAGLSMYRSKMVDEGWSEGDVRSDLKKSSERRVTGGISQEQAEQTVKRAYQSTLGREADSAGLATYVQKVRQNHWSEGDVAKALRNSPEYRQKHKK